MASKSTAPRSSASKKEAGEGSLSEMVLGSNAQALDNMFEGVSAPGTDHRELVSRLRDSINTTSGNFQLGLTSASTVLLQPGSWTEEAAQSGPDFKIHLDNSKSWSSLVQGAATGSKLVGVPSPVVDAAKTAIYAGQALDKALSGASAAAAGLSDLQGISTIGEHWLAVCSQARQEATRLETFERIPLTPAQDADLSKLLEQLVSSWEAASLISSKQVAAWALEMVSDEATETPNLLVDLTAIRSVPVGELEPNGAMLPWQAWVDGAPALQGQIMSAFPDMTIADWRKQGWDVTYQTEGLDGAEAADRMLTTTTREGELRLSSFLVSQ